MACVRKLDFPIEAALHKLGRLFRTSSGADVGCCTSSGADEPLYSVTDTTSCEDRALDTTLVRHDVPVYVCLSAAVVTEQFDPGEVSVNHMPTLFVSLPSIIILLVPGIC